MTVGRYFAVPEGWRPPRDSTVRVAARLQRRPLVVERNFGKGRVMAFLTTAAPTWNNWARNPSFVVAMQDLQAYLSAAAGRRASRGWLARRWSCDWTRPFISRRSVHPARSGRRTAQLRQCHAVRGRHFGRIAGRHRFERLLRGAACADRRRRGDAPLCRQRRSGRGRFDRANGPQLAARPGRASSTSSSRPRPCNRRPGGLAGYNLSEALLCGLVLLLLVEQIVAWSASYHPRAASGLGGRRGDMTGRFSL